MKIPKILHQIWIGPKKPPLKLMRTWKDKHPDYEYMLWDEKLLAKHFPDGLFNQSQYDAIPEINGKCDIARYEILNRFGGVYIDADSICIKHLDDWMLENDSFSCWENEARRPGLIAVGVLGSTKNNILMEMLIDAIHHLPYDTLTGLEAWVVVGPNLITELYNAAQYRALTIYPSWYFIPRHLYGTLHKLTELPYAFQLFGSSTGDTFFNYETSDEDQIIKDVEKLLKDSVSK